MNTIIQYFAYNKSFLSGAMDMIAIKQPDNTIKISNLYVRFGQFQVIKAKKKKVELYVNDEKVDNILMILSEQGEAVILKESEKKMNRTKLNSTFTQSQSSPDNSITDDDFSQSESDKLNSSFNKSDDISDDSEDESFKKENLSNINLIDSSANEELDNSNNKSYELDQHNKSMNQQTREETHLLNNLRHFKINEDYNFFPSSFKRKMSFDILNNNNIHSSQNNNKNNSFNSKTFEVVQENNFTIERKYPTLNITENMKVELSNSWYNISKYKDNKNFNIIELFNQSVYTKEDFYKDPWKVLNNSNLAIKNGTNIYTWKVIAPMLISQLAYGETLPQETLTKLTSQSNGFLMWRKINIDAFKIDVSKSLKEGLLLEKEKEGYMSDRPKGGNYELSPVRNYKKKKVRGKSRDLKNIQKTQQTHVNLNSTLNTENPKKKKYKKLYKFSNEQIKLMKLKYGKNEVRFIVNSQYQGKQELSCQIYLWDYDDKIVVSDFDGTITRTDVIGQLIPLIFWKDWTHKKITNLFSSINDNGYKVIYLSARSMIQHTQTKKYLSSIVQSNTRMPEGPIFMSPDGLFDSFTREVIEKQPQELKINFLTQILNLFPDDELPFYCGFGNKNSDFIAYECVGIPHTKIFLINEKGIISNPGNVLFKSTYEMLYEMKDQIFPCVKGANSCYYDFDYFKPKEEEFNLTELFS